MGLLDYADEYGKRFLGLLGNSPLVQLLKAGQGEAPPPDVSPNALANTLKNIPVFQNDAASNEALGNNLLNAVNPIGLLGKIVYHGSPHKFDKFDASKIGTGEGAQAYGHGVYLADSPGVAEGYADKLSKVMVDGDPYEKIPRFIEYGNQNPRRIDINAPSNTLSPAEMALAYINMSGGSFYKASRELREMASEAIPDAAKYSKAATIIDSGKLKASKVHEGYGNLYKADLPDEWIPKMLDWDKPLSQQSKEVQEAANKALAANLKTRDIGNGLTDVYLYPNGGGSLGVFTKDALPEVLANPASRMPMTGAQFYKALEGAGTGAANGPNAAASFNSFGIPGIKYLDGGSRGAGQGTYNYVIFPGLEDKVKILERNGVPLNGLLGP